MISKKALKAWVDRLDDQAYIGLTPSGSGLEVVYKGSAILDIGANPSEKGAALADRIRNIEAITTEPILQWVQAPRKPGGPPNPHMGPLTGKRIRKIADDPGLCCDAESYSESDGWEACDLQIPGGTYGSVGLLDDENDYEVWWDDGKIPWSDDQLFRKALAFIRESEIHELCEILPGEGKLNA